MLVKADETIRLRPGRGSHGHSAAGGREESGLHDRRARRATKQKSAQPRPTGSSKAERARLVLLNGGTEERPVDFADAVRAAARGGGRRARVRLLRLQEAGEAAAAADAGHRRHGGRVRTICRPVQAASEPLPPAAGARARAGPPPRAGPEDTGPPSPTPEEIQQQASRRSSRRAREAEQERVAHGEAAGRREAPPSRRSARRPRRSASRSSARPSRSASPMRSARPTRSAKPDEAQGGARRERSGTAQEPRGGGAAEYRCARAVRWSAGSGRSRIAFSAHGCGRRRARPGIDCVVHVTQVPGGDVTSVKSRRVQWRCSRARVHRGRGVCAPRRCRRRRTRRCSSATWTSDFRPTD